MTSTFATKAEAVSRLIVEPIEAGEATADEFDIDAIAAEVLDTDERGQWGYADAYDSLQRDEDGTADVGASDAATEAFWDVVRDCAK